MNASERTPVVFIHGLWLLPSSWDRWADLFEDRGPLLIIEGENDHTVPPAIANASFKRQRQNIAVTEIEKVTQSRSLAHHRQRLARGGRPGTRVRQALRPTHDGKSTSTERSFS